MFFITIAGPHYSIIPSIPNILILNRNWFSDETYRSKLVIRDKEIQATLL